MDRNKLWNKFLKSGKVSDYLAYSKAEQHEELDLYSNEFAEEFYFEQLDLERDDYADKDDWSGDS